MKPLISVPEQRKHHHTDYKPQRNRNKGWHSNESVLQNPCCECCTTDVTLHYRCQTIQSSEHGSVTEKTQLQTDMWNTGPGTVHTGEWLGGISSGASWLWRGPSSSPAWCSCRWAKSPWERLQQCSSPEVEGIHRYSQCSTDISARDAPLITC